MFLHFNIRYLTFLTADSANPLALGLYGEDTSWEMLFSAHQDLKSLRNCGPPSERIVFGQPSRLNQAVIALITEAVVKKKHLGDSLDKSRGGAGT